jgi:hypothetical protein
MRTFPDTSPENVAVIHVEHDPLPVQRILVHRAAEKIIMIIIISSGASVRGRQWEGVPTYMYPRGSLLVMYRPFVTWWLGLAYGLNRWPELEFGLSLSVDDIGS